MQVAVFSFFISLQIEIPRPFSLPKQNFPFAISLPQYEVWIVHQTVIL